MQKIYTSILLLCWISFAVNIQAQTTPKQTQATRLDASSIKIALMKRTK